MGLENQILLVSGPRSPERVVRRFRDLAPAATMLDNPSSEALQRGLEMPRACVVLFGGDGTLNRHLAALVQAQAPVLLVPTGSGNDFARALGIRGVPDALALFRVLLRGEAQYQSCDLGLASFFDGRSRYFSCCLNVGMDADAARRANTLPPWL